MARWQQLAGATGAVHANATEVVGRHIANGCRAQYSLTIQSAAIQQALQKPRIVGRRGGQTSATGFQRDRFAQVDQAWRQGPVWIGFKRFGNAVVVFGWHHKARVHHAQWAQDIVQQVLPQRLATGNLHQSAQQVGGAAVFPHGARLEHQGYGGQHSGELAVAAVARGQPRLRVLALNRLAAQNFVGQAGGVAQQVLHRGC